MIDWVGCDIPFLHYPLYSGQIIKIDAKGEVEWQAPAWTEAEGSHSSTIRVFSDGHMLSDGRMTHLRISGNPIKFLQGHNIFGTDDLSIIMIQFMIKLSQILNIKLESNDLELIRSGEYNLTRIDINYGFTLPARCDVLSWIRSAEHKGKTRSGKSSRKGDTLYFGQHSRRWSIKFYSKGGELEVHKLPETLLNTPLLKFADNILRAEIVFRSLELKRRNIQRAKNFTPSFVNALYQEYMSRLEMKSQHKLKDDIVANLPRHLQATYLLWQQGYDLKMTMKETTYYAHCGKLKKYDIDINLPPNDITKMDNVVPLIRVLEAKPVGIPQWAYDLKLVVC